MFLNYCDNVATDFKLINIGYMKDKELNKEAKRMLDLIDSGSTSMISEEVAPYYVDISTYTDGEIFELEKKKLFRE